MIRTPTLCVFTLQGLGNAILALPVILLLTKHYDVTLYLFNKQAFDFYTSLHLNIKLEKFESAWRLFTKRIEPCGVAVALYPCWKRELFALLRALAPKKISFHDPAYFLTHVAPWIKINREPIHDLENNFHLLEHLGIKEEFPDVAPLFNSPKPAGKRAVLHPTSSSSVKFYPKELWIEIMEYLSKKGYEVHVIGGENAVEKEFCRSILEQWNPPAQPLSHFAKPLHAIGQLIASAELFIGLDSAPAHLAALLDRKVITLWSFADYRRIYPYGNHVHLYFPKETTLRKGYFFGYPKEPPAGLRRASAKEIIAILEGKRREDFAMASKYKLPTKCYVF